ncbi:MAG: MFS transporter [Chloroflexi bacterium]|nr:MFS transporter [Chloroflexota bacterium]
MTARSEAVLAEREQSESASPPAMSTSTDAHAPAGVFSRKHRALTIGILLSVTAIAIEGMAVATIMPSVALDLGGLEFYGWAFSAFMLTSLTGAIAGGQAADRRNPAVPALAGFVFFGAGLIVAGAAPGWPVLLVGRAIQGVGAGALGATAYVVVARGYPEPLRPRLMALLSTAWVAPALVGPAVAGQVAEHAAWRWVFVGILPPVAVGAVMLLRGLRDLPTRTPSEEPQRAGLAPPSALSNSPSATPASNARALSDATTNPAADAHSVVSAAAASNAGALSGSLSDAPGDAHSVISAAAASNAGTLSASLGDAADSDSVTSGASAGSHARALSDSLSNRAVDTDSVAAATAAASNARTVSDSRSDRAADTDSVAAATAAASDPRAVSDSLSDRAEDARRVITALRLTAGVALVLFAAGLDLPLALPPGLVGLLLAAPALRSLLPQGTFVGGTGLPASIALRGLLAFGFFGAEAVIPLGLSTQRGLSPSEVGLALTAAALGWVAASWLQDRAEAQARGALTARALRVAGGLLMMALGTAAAAFAILNSTVPAPLVIVAWTVTGFGMGLCYPATTLTALGLAPSGEEGFASASLQVAETVGIATGTGAVGALVAMTVRIQQPMSDGLAWAFVITVAAILLALVPALRLAPHLSLAGQTE